MTFLHVVKQNILHNRRNYLAYFFNSLMAIMVFFLFTLLHFHPQLQDFPASSGMIADYSILVLGAGEVITAVLSFVFLWYAFTYFLKSRQYDLGVLQLLGISKKKLQGMIFLENMTMAFISILTGLLLGAFFAKAILLLIGSFLHLAKPLEFYVPKAALLITAGVFLFIFLLISLFSSFAITHLSSLQLTKKEVAGESLPKASFLKTILGLLLLFSGYFSLAVFTESGGLTSLILCVLLTSLGTFITFHEGLVWLFLQLKKRLNKGSQLLWVNHFLFQLKEQATLFSLIALTASVALIGAGMAQILGSDALDSGATPTFSYTIFPMSKDPAVARNVSQELFQKMKKIDNTSQMFEIQTTGFTEEMEIQDLVNVNPNTTLYWPSYPALIKASDYQKLRTANPSLPELPSSEKYTMYDFPAAQRYLKEVKELPEKERQAKGTFQFNGEKHPLTFMKLPTLFYVNAFDPTIISDELFKEVQKETKDNHPFFVLQFPNWSKDKKASIALDQFLEEESDNHTSEFGAPEFAFTSKFAIWQQRLQSDGIIQMVGFLIGSVFFLFSASILTFRLFGKLKVQQSYYHSLNILGVDKNVRQKMVLKDLAYMFFLPLIFTFSHSTVAFWGVHRLTNLTFWPIYFKLVLIYLLFQTVFFIGASSNYMRKIENKLK